METSLPICFPTITDGKKINYCNYDVTAGICRLMGRNSGTCREGFKDSCAHLLRIKNIGGLCFRVEIFLSDDRRRL